MNYEELRLIASPLGVDEGVYINCISCYSRRKSMSIKKLDTCILYNCFRCGVKGRVNNKLMYDRGKATSQVNSLFKREVPTLPHDCFDLFPGDVAYFNNKYNLTIHDLAAIGIKYSPSMHRYIFPVKFGEQVVGFTAKKADSKQIGPKYISNTNSSHILVNTPTMAINTSVIVFIVEDILSCYRLKKYASLNTMSTHYIFVALLGTNINKKTIELLNVYYNKFNIVLALDKDATTRAFNMKLRYNKYFNSFRVQPLLKDPKYMTFKEIKDTFFSDE